MSTTIDPTAPRSAALETTVITSWRTPIALGIFAVVAGVLFLGAPRGADVAEFRVSNLNDVIQLPNIAVPVSPTGITVLVLLLLLAGYATWIVAKGRRVTRWVPIVFAVLFMIGFLSWAGAGAVIPIPGLLAGTVTLSVPLVFGAMAGVISERVGVVNIAIEGQLLAGAFSSAVVASVTGNAFLGLVAAAAAGMLVSFVLAAFAIKYLVEQVIVGVVLNVLVIGLTSFLFSQVLSENTPLLNSPERFPRMPIPFLADIPVLGPVLFQQTVIVYCMYAAVAVIAIAMFKTRWGLRMRAVGEHPTAADTVGIKVGPTRFWNVSLAGAIAGFGGAFFTLGSVGAFNKEMTNGMGFIALAAVIFGQWHPIKATLAALLFGFATNLQNVLGVIGSPVPSEFMLMLPYVVTIFAVAGLVGVSRPPAADGKPYIKS